MTSTIFNTHVRDELSFIYGEPWITPTMQNAWVYYDATNHPVRYRGAGGFVQLEGLVASGAINSSMFTLPVGYRPTRHVVFQTQGASGGYYEIRVISNGSVESPIIPNNTWMSICCTFLAA